MLIREGGGRDSTCRTYLPDQVAAASDRDRTLPPETRLLHSHRVRGTQRIDRPRSERRRTRKGEKILRRDVGY